MDWFLNAILCSARVRFFLRSVCMGFGVVVFLVASSGVLADWRMIVVPKSSIAFLGRSDKPLDVYGVWL